MTVIAACDSERERERVREKQRQRTERDETEQLYPRKTCTVASWSVVPGSFDLSMFDRLEAKQNQTVHSSFVFCSRSLLFVLLFVSFFLFPSFLHSSIFLFSLSCSLSLFVFSSSRSLPASLPPSPCFCGQAGWYSATVSAHPYLA